MNGVTASSKPGLILQLLEAQVEVLFYNALAFSSGSFPMKAVHFLKANSTLESNRELLLRNLERKAAENLFSETQKFIRLLAHFSEDHKPDSIEKTSISDYQVKFNDVIRLIRSLYQT